MTTITRRTALAGGAALQLLPAAALAAPATLPLLPLASYAQPADPAVEAYRVWRAAHDAYVRSFDRPHVPDDDPLMNATGDAAFAANLALCDTIATTPEGLAAQVRLALYTFGSIELGGDWHNPDDYHIDGFGDDQGKRLLLAMLAGAESMAEAAS